MAVIVSNDQQVPSRDAILCYLRSVKAAFLGEMERYHEFLGALDDFRCKRIETSRFCTKIVELFKGHPNLLTGLKNLFPDGHEITTYIEKILQDEYTEAISFIRKVKNHFWNVGQNFRSFVVIMNMALTREKSICDVYKEVETLFQDRHDLLEEFAHFLKFGISRDNVSSNKAFLYGDEKNSATTIGHAHPYLMLPASDKHSPASSMPNDRQYLMPPASNRSSPPSSVINKEQEFLSYKRAKHSIKNNKYQSEYEEMLNRYEDERHELDMLFELINTTTKKVEELIEKMQHNTVEKDPQSQSKNLLKFSQLQLIARLYGAYSLEVEEILCENASSALPIILERLKQKREEVMSFRNNFRPSYFSTRLDIKTSGP